jgi:2-oxoisovalerate dehydrogenase E1 component alpha subunit
VRNQKPLSLYIPEPPARPGEVPDFSHLLIPAAGETPRPDIGEKPERMRDLVYGLVRVLGEDNRAHGPWDPRLTPDTMLAGLRAMLLTRLYDDRMQRVQRQGKTSFYVKCLGEEAVAVGAAMALDAHDMCFPTYRQQGLLITRGYPLVDMMNQVYSNARDPLRGRQLPIMYSSRDYGFFSISGNLTTQVPQAVGWAMASAYSEDTRIAAAWTGEGATAEGDFHHAMTFATVYRAPVIINIVNNQWAISSFSGIAGGEATTFAARALAYGLPGLRVDGNDFLAVFAATQWAVERARANLGPTLIELFTYRGEAHSTSDDPSRYRPADEGKAWPLGDPIERLKAHLVAEAHWDEERHAALTRRLIEEIRAAGREAESHGTLGHGPGPDPGDMFEDIFREMPWHIAEQKREAGF